MTDVLETLVGRSVAMAVLILLYAAATPLLARRYAVKWLYYVWLIVVLGLVIPFRPPMEAALFRIDAPLSIPDIQTLPHGASSAFAAGPLPDSRDTQTQEFPLRMLAGYLWAAGAAAVLAFHAVRHFRFMNMARRWSEDMADPHVLRMLKDIKDELGIRREVSVRICHCVPVPMLVGLLRPVVLLPPSVRSSAPASGDFALILKHELVHLKRNDLWYRGLVLLATAVHWFNPAVYLMARAIAELCEMSCDERALRGENFRQRQRYCETILRVAGAANGHLTSWSTNFTGGIRSMKFRFQSILDTTPKRTGITVLIVVLLAAFLAGMSFGHRMPTATGEALEGAGGEAVETYVPSMEPYARFLTKTGHETVPFEWEGRWVRSIYDEPPGQKPVLYFLHVEDADVEGWSSPVHLRAVRSPDTGEIVRLEEMSANEVFDLPLGDQVIGYAMNLVSKK